MSGLCGTGILLTLISFCDGLGLVQERLAMRGLSYGLAGAMSAASSYPFRHAWLSQQANKADQSIKVLSEALVSAASVDGQCVSTLPSTGTIVSSISTISPDVAAVRAAVSATTTTLVSLQALAKVVTMVGAVRGHPKLVAQGLRRIKSSRWKEHNSGNDVQGELSLRQGKFDRLGNELSISDAEIRTLQAVVAGTATTMLTFGSFTTDVVATALTKSVTLSSYDKIFHNMGLAMGKAGIPSLFGFPAVLVAAAGTGVVASLISLNAPCKRKALNLSPKQRQDMASKQAVLKEVK